MRTVLVWYESGGPFILPLIVVGAVGLLILAERIVYIVIRSKIHARPFIEEVVSLVRAGKVEEALRVCADHKAALPDLGLVILRNKDREEDDLVSAAETATLTTVPELTRRLAWLPTLALTSVMLGVVGGIANLHDGLSGVTAMPAALAYALRPLGVGVVTAIPLLLGHAFAVSEARKLSAQLDEFAVRLVNALVDRPDVRLGHRD
jgi:biopolymer transport protein ExbB